MNPDNRFNQLKQHWSQVQQHSSDSETELGELLAYFHQLPCHTEFTAADRTVLHGLIAHCRVACDHYFEIRCYYVAVIDILRSVLNRQRSVKEKPTLKRADIKIHPEI